MITNQQLERYKEIMCFTPTVPAPRRGAAIFSRPGPRTWDEFTGQARAKGQLQASIHSAQSRHTRLEHVLIAAGQYGTGKSALARLVAAEMEVGIIELSGQVSIDQARPILRGMEDRDILFLDEVHAMVTHGKANAEWLLHLLEDGRLLSAAGAEKMPDITVIAATTDAGKLPETILNRFPIRSVLDPYTPEQATEIALYMAGNLRFGSETPPLTARTAVLVADAANGNPRDMRALLTILRDAYYGGLAEVDENGDYDLSTMLEWAGLTADGLTKIAQDYLTVMMVDFSGKAGEKTIASALGEPGPLRHVERLLLQKGFIAVTATGRQMTKRGVTRATQLLGGAA